MTTEIHGVQSIATGQFCTDCGVYLGKPSGHPEQCRKCGAEKDAATILKAMALVATLTHSEG